MPVSVHQTYGSTEWGYVGLKGLQECFDSKSAATVADHVDHDSRMSINKTGRSERDFLCSKHQTERKMFQGRSKWQCATRLLGLLAGFEKDPLQH